MEKLFWRNHYLSPWCFQVCYKNRAERFSSPKILRLKNKLQDKLEIDNNHVLRNLNKLASLQDTWTLPRMEVKQLLSQPVPQ